MVGPKGTHQCSALCLCGPGPYNTLHKNNGAQQKGVSETPLFPINRKGVTYLASYKGSTRALTEEYIGQVNSGR